MGSCVTKMVSSSHDHPFLYYKTKARGLTVKKAFSLKRQKINSSDYVTFYRTDLLFAQNHFNTISGYHNVDLLFLYILQFEFIL